MASEDVQKVMEKLQLANKIMEDLIDAAMADAQISEDEKQMLFSINEHLNEYVRLTIATISDNIVTAEEQEKMKNLEQHIIEAAKTVAMKDSEISEEEKVLLDRLIRAVKELGE